MPISTLPIVGDLATDPMIPHRDEMLDADPMNERLARLFPGLGVIDSCEIRRVKYRLGESLRVVYRLTAGAAAETISLRTFPTPGSTAGSVPGSAEVARREQQRWPRPAQTGLPIVGHLPDLQAVVWRLPADRRLGQLDALIHPPASWSAVTGGRWTSSELVEYAPERSATARMTDAAGGTVGFAKAYRAGTATGLAERYRYIADGLRASVGIDSPRVLDWRDDDDVLLLEAMPGVAWDDLSTERREVALGQLGRAIATVHQLPTAALAPFRRLETRRVSHSAELIAQARPDVAVVCQRLAELLGRPMPTDGRPDVFLHGDVHPGNSLFTAEGISLIDFDQAGRGPAVADIASLIARLRFGVCIGELSADQGHRLITRFLDGYSTVAPRPSPATLRAHIAAASVAERALRVVNRVRPVGLAHLESILIDALNILNGQPHDTFV